MVQLSLDDNKLALTTQASIANHSHFIIGLTIDNSFLVISKNKTLKLHDYTRNFSVILSIAMGLKFKTYRFGIDLR